MLSFLQCASFSAAWFISSSTLLFLQSSFFSPHNFFSHSLVSTWQPGLDFPSRLSNDTWFLQQPLVSFFKKKRWNYILFYWWSNHVFYRAEHQTNSFFCLINIRVFSDFMLYVRTDCESEQMLGFSGSVKHLQCTTWIQHTLLWFRLTSDWYQSWFSGMFRNVMQRKVGQEFQASLLYQKHDHHKLTEFQQQRWKHFCLTDRHMSAGGGVKKDPQLQWRQKTSGRGRIQNSFNPLLQVKVLHWKCYSS